MYNFKYVTLIMLIDGHKVDRKCIIFFRAKWDKIG